MIIGISGKMQSGKDTAGAYIQSLHPGSKIRRHADKLKEFVCMLIGCTKEMFEDNNFKDKILDKSWWKWEIVEYGTGKKRYVPYHTSTGAEDARLIKMTPRILMQLLGVDCGRDIIHPDIWVNGLYADYTPESMWIIPDVRYPNEVFGVESRGGIVLRINRDVEYRLPKLWEEFQTQDTLDEWDEFLKATNMYEKVYHESETAIDEYPFNPDFVIEGNCTIPELHSKVEGVLKLCR